MKESELWNKIAEAFEKPESETVMALTYGFGPVTNHGLCKALGYYAKQCGELVRESARMRLGREMVISLLLGNAYLWPCTPAYRPYRAALARKFAAEAAVEEAAAELATEIEAATATLASPVPLTTTEPASKVAEQ